MIRSLGRVLAERRAASLAVETVVINSGPVPCTDTQAKARMGTIKVVGAGLPFFGLQATQDSACKLCGWHGHIPFLKQLCLLLARSLQWAIELSQIA